MNLANLITMANRIGDFFQSFPDTTEGKLGLVQHIARFWAPSMRNTLLSQLDSTEAKNLKPFVLEAILAHRDLLVPQNG